MDILAGCCPFLKIRNNLDSDEPLLTPNGSVNGSNTHLPSPVTPTSTDPIDPNNNKTILTPTDSDTDFEESEDDLEDFEDDDQPDCIKELDEKLIHINQRGHNFDKDSFRENKSIHQKELSTIYIPDDSLPKFVKAKRKLDYPEADSNSSKFLGGLNYYALNQSSSFDINSDVIRILNSWVILS